MADETKKATTTTKKRTTTSKPKVEEPKPTSIEEQMAQMMAMMMAQQQQLMELMAKTQQVENEVEEMEEKVEEQPRKTKRQRKENKITKQDLRRKYKGIDIYLTNITQGTVVYRGKNISYEWKHTGDVEVVTIDDVINMPSRYLNEPWLVVDSYENAEEIIDDIVQALRLEKVYEYVDIIQDMQENINDVTIDEIERAITLSRKRGYDISLDLVVLIQKKIETK